MQYYKVTEKGSSQSWLKYNRHHYIELIKEQLFTKTELNRMKFITIDGKPIDIISDGLVTLIEIPKTKTHWTFNRRFKD